MDQSRDMGGRVEEEHGEEARRWYSQQHFRWVNRIVSTHKLDL